MKVILIKDSEAGKAYTVVETKAGYGQNYLIRNGLAMAYNPQNKKKLKSILAKEAASLAEKRASFSALKKEIETLKFSYALKVGTQDGQEITHHSVTNKQILSSLADAKVNLNKHQLEKVQLNTLGLHYVKITLFEDIVALLKVELLKEE